MTAYLSYTLRMRTLFRGWPIMVNDTHTRRRTRMNLSVICMWAVKGAAVNTGDHSVEEREAEGVIRLPGGRLVQFWRWAAGVPPTTSSHDWRSPAKCRRPAICCSASTGVYRRTCQGVLLPVLFTTVLLNWGSVPRGVCNPWGWGPKSWGVNLFYFGDGDMKTSVLACTGKW